MEPDYPAAHSMDSSWYAVDKNGHVALFVTGAGGAMADNAYSPAAREFLEDLDPEEVEAMGIDPAQLNDIAPEQLPAEERVFVYETGPLDECLAERYHQRQAPRQPLHIDELPPAVRAAIGQTRFETLD